MRVGDERQVALLEPPAAKHGDLELRLRASQHDRQGSLAGLFRRLMVSHGQTGKGLTQADIIAAASAEACEPMDAFFARHVDGRDELPLPELLARVGVQVVSEATPRAYSGLVLAPDRIVRNIEPGSPAEIAGLMLGDEVIAVAGRRVRTGDEAQARLAERKAGEKLEVAVFRGGRLELRPLTLVSDPHRIHRFELAAAATLLPATLAARQAWLARDAPAETHSPGSSSAISVR